jgi:2-pyrone-4,6-dicarboxylate lactonase
MLSLGEKTSKKGPPWDDVIPIARAYLEAAPDRCVWASDWPHPGIGCSAAERRRPA